MKRLEIIGLEGDGGRLVDALHETGLVQISDLSSRIKTDFSDLLVQESPAQRGKDASSILIRVKWLLDLMESVKEEGKENMVREFLRPEAPKTLKIGNVFEEAELLDSIEPKLRELGDKKDRLINEEIDLKKIWDSVSKLKELEIDLGWLGESEYLLTEVGIVPAGAMQHVKDIQAVTLISKIDKETEVMIISFLKEEKEQMLKRLRNIGFERIDLKGSGNPAEFLRKTESRILENAAESKRITGQIRKISE